jgi:hypothetical protein
MGARIACSKLSSSGDVDEAPGAQEVQLGGQSIWHDVGFRVARRIETLKLILQFNEIGFSQVRREENLAK